MRSYLLPPLCLVIFAIVATSPGSGSGPGPFALASSGDRSDAFQRCLAKCARDTCTTSTTNGGGHPNALALRLTRWTCTDECKYACTHAVTDLATESGVRVEQFYGKWAFWRLAGMQEPASVAFSVANLLMHVLGADWLRRGVHPAHPMRPFYLTWSYVSVNAWVWSAVFHTRGAFAPSFPPPLFVSPWFRTARPAHLITIYPLFPAGRSRGPSFSLSISSI